MLMVEGVQITWLGHDGFKLKKEKVVYIDPFQLASAAEPGDLVCVTHEHSDHLSPDDLKKVVGRSTTVVTIAACAEAMKPLRPKAVRVVKPGFVTFEQIVDLRPGKVRRVTLRLRAEAPESP